MERLLREALRFKSHRIFRGLREMNTADVDRLKSGQGEVVWRPRFDRPGDTESRNGRGNR